MDNLPQTTMKHIAWVFALCLLLAGPDIAAAQDVVLRGGWLFDGVGDDVVRNTGLVILRGRIMEVGADLSGRDLSGVEVIDLADDDYILPGFFDIHAHYSVTFNETRRDEYTVNPVVYLANGVTSTFPAGEYNPEEMLETRKRIDRGEQVGPRLFNSGPYFGPARPGWNPDATDQDIYDEVDYWAERGVAGFKAKRISPRHLAPLIERAHQHGLTVTGHLDSGYNDTINPRDAILLGIDRIEHFLGGDAIDPERPAYASLVDVVPGTPAFERIVALFIEHGVFFSATLTAYGYYGHRQEGYDYWVDERTFLTPYMQELIKGRRQRLDSFQQIYDVKQKTIKAFYDAGGLIALGTDHPSVGEYLSGFSVHRELEAFVRAGIPPVDALKFGTLNSARALRVSDQIGSIEAGKWADLSIIKGNPLEDITRTRTVHTVMKAGTVYDTATLLKSVEGTMGPTNAEEAKAW